MTLAELEHGFFDAVKTQNDAASNAAWRDAGDLRWAARHWATRIGVRLRQVHIRPMTSKWASMSTAGRLTLDPDLLAIPQELGEYIIVHELVHLLAPNHGKLFKSFMLAYLPDWEQRQQRLRSFELAAQVRRTSQSASHLLDHPLL